MNNIRFDRVLDRVEKAYLECLQSYGLPVELAESLAKQVSQCFANGRYRGDWFPTPSVAFDIARELELCGKGSLDYDERFDIDDSDVLMAQKLLYHLDRRLFNTVQIAIRLARHP